MARSVTTRPFAEAALALRDRGMAVVPCPSDDGKSPRGAVRGFNKWKGPPPIRQIERLIESFGDANIGVVTSASGVTVVDVDGDDHVLRRVIEQCGDSPLITRTPSGGSHLWFRSRGEKSANLRREGIPVDVKGTGAGIVVVPPSFRRSTLRPYSFERGSWDDLTRLPAARAGSLSRGVDDLASPASSDRVGPGQRNDELFRFGLRHARSCQTYGALVDMMRGNNAAFAPPLDDAEVVKVAQSVWGYQTKGRNFAGTRGSVRFSAEDIEVFKAEPDGADAFLLMATLRAAHDGRRNFFAISPRGMADAGLMQGWGEKRLRRARGALERMGLLELVYAGGKGARDPSLFRLKP